MLWLVIAYALICFSAGDLALSITSLVQTIFVFAFLVIIRLYDDLFSAKVDAGLPDRSYTDPEIHKELSKVLVVCIVLIAAIVAFLSEGLGLYLLIFWVVNTILYATCFKYNSIQLLLPLLKYPFVVLVLSQTFSWAQLGLILAFVLYEQLDNNKGSHLVNALLLTGAYVLLWASEVADPNWLFLIIGFTCSITLLFTKLKYAPNGVVLLFILTNIIR